MRFILLTLLMLGSVFAAPYAVYLGDMNQQPADPTTQGWTVDGQLSQGVDDNGTLTWELNDNNGDIHPTMRADYGAAHVPQPGDAWSFSVNARVIQGNGTQTNVIQWSNGNIRYLFFPYVNANGNLGVFYFGANGKGATLPDFTANDNAYHTWAIVHDGFSSKVTYDGKDVIALGSIPASGTTRGVYVGGGTGAGTGAIRVANASFDATLANPPSTTTLARVFASHMVLQRGEPVAVYGQDAVNPGAQAVQVQFAGQTKSTTTDAAGNWRVEFDNLTASATGRDLVVTGSAVVTLTDVLVGEVWLAAGQSNMNATVARSAGVNPPHPETFPLIRMCNWEGTVDTGKNTVYNAAKFTNLTAENFYTGTWKTMDAASVMPQSAVAYHFAHYLAEDLKVPIGIIDISIGGTSTEAFISPAALQSEPHLKEAFQHPYNARNLGQWTGPRLFKNVYNNNVANYTRTDPTKPIPHPYAPGFLYATAMPYLSAFTFKGVLWYQGESNTEFTTGNYQINGNSLSDYQTFVMKTLVNDWRKTFKKPDLPFLMVQLPRINAPNRALWPFYREALTRVAVEIDGCELATIMEFGEDGNVHPLQKAPVGQRLATIARAKVYGEDIVFSDPVYKKHKIVGNQIFLGFEHVGAGLADHDGGELRNFEIAGADRNFVAATAVIVGETIKVSATSISAPVAVRHAWKMNADVDLFNADGFSASSFRTDKWIAAPGRKLRVACVGDSITHGSNLGSETYPAQLAEMLGSTDFEVRKFGKSGSGIYRPSNHYRSSEECAAAIAWQPDIVICNLGINDITDWGRFTEKKFKDEYLALIDAFAQSGSTPLLIQWSNQAPLYPGQKFYDSPNLITLNHWILEAAGSTNAILLDMENPLSGHPEWFPDSLHPNRDGAHKIAEVTYLLLKAIEK